MKVMVRPTRDNRSVWRDIDGEVVIADREGNTIRILNKTASLIWALADGNRQTEDILAAVCHKFEVTPEEARLDIEEFCQQLLEAGLISMK